MNNIGFIILSNTELFILTSLLIILMVGFIIYMIWMIRTVAKNRKEARRNLLLQKFHLLIPFIEKTNLKSYDELTLKEKQELVRLGIRMWQEHHPYFEIFYDSRPIAQEMLGLYNAINEGREYPITEPAYQQQDIEEILHNLPEFNKNENG